MYNMLDMAPPSDLNKELPNRDFMFEMCLEKSLDLSELHDNFSVVLTEVIHAG